MTQNSTVWDILATQFKTIAEGPLAGCHIDTYLPTHIDDKPDFVYIVQQDAQIPVSFDRGYRPPTEVVTVTIRGAVPFEERTEPSTMARSIRLCEQLRGVLNANSELVVNGRSMVLHDDMEWSYSLQQYGFERYRTCDITATYQTPDVLDARAI